MRIAVVTPTGDRPGSLARQSHYLERSILPPETKPHWIVVDDGKNPYSPPAPQGWYTSYFLRKDQSGCSLVMNLMLGLSHALTLSPDYVFIWEDDDWYGPDRIIDQLDYLLRGRPMHGYFNSLYYHVPLQRFKLMPNKTASLFEMAFTGELVEPILDFLSAYDGDGKGLDGKLWRMFSGLKQAPPRKKFTSIGLKGLAGRDGIGCGHRPDRTYEQDMNYGYLLSLIGQDDLDDILGG